MPAGVAGPPPLKPGAAADVAAIHARCVAALEAGVEGGGPLPAAGELDACLVSLAFHLSAAFGEPGTEGCTFEAGRVINVSYSEPKPSEAARREAALVFPGLHVEEDRSEWVMRESWTEEGWRLE